MKRSSESLPEMLAFTRIIVCDRELVPLCGGKLVQRYFHIPATLHLPQIVNGFMVKNQLAVTVKLAPFAKFAVGCFHLLTPFLWGIRWVPPFPHIERMEIVLRPAKRLLFEIFLRELLAADTGRRKQQISPGRS